MNYDNRENNAFSSKTMNCSNGRVNILGPNVDARFQMTDKIPVNHTTSFRDALTGNWNTSAYLTHFFQAKMFPYYKMVLREEYMINLMGNL